MADVATVTLVAINPSNVPAYISDLAPFDVRQLNGAYAPTNGKDTLRDVTPSEWISGDPANNAQPGAAPNILVPWCGGAEDPDNNRLWVTGGGHDDGANNGLYYLDFNGTTTWTGAALADISALGSVPYPNPATDVDPYPDGRPGAIHGYDGHKFYNGEFFRSGGSTYRLGGLSGGTYTYNVGAGSWSSHSGSPVAFGSGRILATALNRSAGKILVIQRNSFDVAFFDMSTKTWSSDISCSVAPLGGGSGYPVAACNENNGEVLMIQSGRVIRYTVDWSAETVSNSLVTVSGFSAPSASALLWDSQSGSFWNFGGTAASGNFGTLYEITGSGGSWSASGNGLSSTLATQTDLRGMFNRAILFPEWRAIATLTSSLTAPYIIRLPA